MARQAKIEAQTDFEQDPDFKYDDFDIVRHIVNLVRQYPKSNGKFIRAELRTFCPSVTDRQIARCCEMITDQWEPKPKKAPAIKRKVQGK